MIGLRPIRTKLVALVIGHDLQTQARLLGIPPIALTANAMPLDVERGLAAVAARGRIERTGS